MNEDKLIHLLNSLDDDLVEQEMDKLLDGVEIDMDSINKKAHQKLNRNNKKMKGRKRFAYAAVACLCLLSVTTIYANDISQAIKSFFNKTPIYSTIVDGEAYYLKERYALNDHITLESIMVSEGNLEMEITSNLDSKELKDINIIPKNNPDTVYFPGGYSEEQEKYYFLFMNKTEENYNIKPFKDFKLIIAGNSYEISLEKAKSLDAGSGIYTSNAATNGLEGINIGAKIIEGNEKLNIQLIASFEDKNLRLAKYGKPTEARASGTFENLGKDGLVSSGSGLRTDDLYVFDGTGNEYRLETPKDSKGRPVTVFETNAPKDKKLTLKLPAIIAAYHETVGSFSLDIPDKGEVAVNKEIDFTIQKAIVKNIKRISPTSAEVEFQLNIGANEKIRIRSFSFYSPDIKKASTEFNGDKATMTLEFDEKLAATNLEISYPNFVINGNWIIDMQ
ncbi:hypothetical protein [Geosporobacter ferrireducens]|uniref:DUF4179 domain-containing protein n=1 Tax=Geosporobacter ferrireducens TaxID=1424294 RepID=A0A1D8GIA1_9FIRM|nr:hypothetical protein [Geosporobacter ferrireducens]AOT70637.1 hypothetical protein Gferi_14285 [Geosporobacter ferrireducens]MTI57433.1 hypothetical protein [Geosporobacter ferrireducens]